jgi:DNA-directed RNA polymerase alpha subunit
MRHRDARQEPNEIGGCEISDTVKDGREVYNFPVERQRQGTPIMYQAPKRQDSIPETPRPDLWDYFDGQGIRLNRSIVNALKDLGAYDLKSISALSTKEIAGYRNVGEKSIAGLRVVLQSKGLDLQP